MRDSGWAERRRHLPGEVCVVQCQHMFIDGEPEGRARKGEEQPGREPTVQTRKSPSTHSIPEDSKQSAVRAVCRHVRGASASVHAPPELCELEPALGVLKRVSNANFDPASDASSQKRMAWNVPSLCRPARRSHLAAKGACPKMRPKKMEWE